jgi:acetate kinase
LPRKSWQMNESGARPILILNAGSSSLKVALYAEAGDEALISGQVERIGADAAIRLVDREGQTIERQASAIDTHRDALAAIVETIGDRHPGMRLAAIGHRVVHGGATYSEPTIINEQVIADLTRLESFAPLHQPHNLTGIRVAIESFPGVPQVACFDTGFHRNHPFVNDVFALPQRYYEQGIRRYGFHGLSYEYVTGELRRIAPQLARGKVVVAHLGNGASMCAVHDGRSVASTMGFSTLDGLPMGTRCGQIDPGVLLYMLDHEGLSSARIRDILYNESGLLGLSGGLSNDMRTLEASDTNAARHAIDYFVFRLQREVGAMAAAMGGIDALVFCGGIGENSRLSRRRVCERLGWMGIELDHSANESQSTVISSAFARTTVMIVPTQEELVIARAVRGLLKELHPAESPANRP